MKLRALLCMALLSLNGCQAHEKTPEESGMMPYGKWGFAFFTPHALPAVVTRALIIDSGEVVSTFITLDGTPADPNSVKIWYPRLSLHPYFNKARHPPWMMLFCWDSIIDKKTYETRIIFPASLKETMLTPTGKDRLGNTTWYDTLLLGLAPEGKVRIWLQSYKGDNIPLEPKRITTLSGDQLDACKLVPSRINFDYSIPDGYPQYIKDFIKGKTYPYGNW